MRVKNALKILGGAALILGSMTVPATACMEPCWDWDCPILPGGPTTSGLANGGDTFVRVLSPTQAVIEIASYTTPNMSNTYACSIALTPVDGIARIDRVSMVSLDSGNTLTGAIGPYNWVPTQAPNAEFAQLLKEAGVSMAEQGWQGFFSEVPGGSQGGVAHAFRFEVTLVPGTNPLKLVKALRSQGLLANGSANFDGTLDYGHYHFRKVGDGDVHLVIPGRGPRSIQQRPVRN